MALLSKSEIFAADDKVFEEVPVPEWGGEVRIKTLTGTERDKFEADSLQSKGKSKEANLENFRARFLALCVVDEAGKPLFTSRSDIAMLGAKSVAALDRVFTAAQKLNAMSESDVEELTENFDEEPSESSTSG
jgi:hypothetical protein